MLGVVCTLRPGAQVYTLLPKARKIRNKLRQAGEMQPTSGESTLPSQGDDPEHSPGEALLQQTEETYHDVTEHKQAETTEGEISQQSAALQGELPQPEEGADHSEAHRARMVCRGSAVPDEDTPPDWGDEQTDDDLPHDNNWPWGESGRPSDQGHSEGILGQRPNEPEDAPRDGGIRLLPNRMWQAIRAVQSHMERSRQHRGNSSEGGFSS